MNSSDPFNLEKAQWSVSGTLNDAYVRKLRDNASGTTTRSLGQPLAPFGRPEMGYPELVYFWANPSSVPVNEVYKRAIPSLVRAE